MKRNMRLWFLPLFLISSLMVAPHHTEGFEQGAESEPANAALRSELFPLIQPDLSGLDAVVEDQLRQAREEMVAAIADPTAGVDRLAAAYGTLGQLYHAYELLEAAESCYINANLLAPQNFRWIHLLADVARLEGDLEDAAARYEAAWSLQPYDFAALVRLGETYAELGRAEDAENAFKSALALSPGSPSAMAGLGHLALERRDFGDAVMYFQAALRSAPDANRLHYSLAMAYRGLGDMEAARRHLEQRGTVGVRPLDPVVDQLQVLTEGERVHLVRGRLAYASGRYQEAADEFAAAVAADPRSARSLVNLGTALGQLGDLDAAIEKYQEALAIEPDQTTAHFNLGSTLVKRQRATEAIPHLKVVLKATPYDAEAHLLLARALVASGDDWASLEHFRQAAELDPANVDAVTGGAAALVRLRQFVRAKSVLDAGHKRIPDSGEIAFALARLLAACPDAQVRDGELALELAQAIYTARPNPRHAQLVAQALAELDQCGDAAMWQQKVVDAAIEDGATEFLEALNADLDRYRGDSPCRMPVEEQ
jgi:tetratricopeptide (TPR) repeat protein